MGELIDRLVPHGFREEIRRLRDQDAEIRALGLILPEPKLYEWAHAIGVRRFESLAGLVPALPPRDLRERVAEADVEIFLWTGLCDAHMILDALERHGDQVAGRRAAVLDFGCGCGRQTRFLGNHDDLLAVHGVDVNPDLVRWCQEQLPAVDTRLGEPQPPLPYPDGGFDYVYSLSVFTHLGEKATEAWITELARVLRPGGLALLTIHGAAALERIRGSAELQRIVGIDQTEADRIGAGLADELFAFVVYDDDRLAEARAGETYGVTFIHEDHVRRHWSRDFEVVEFRSGGMRGWQDTVLLRRR
ncbi:MAG: class I SAM-dependent methyltransferase [Planctomycetes bacterium]|nr:class I SAM-dependent methyltransferase [Planctomycetota bacterium]